MSNIWSSEMFSTTHNDSPRSVLLKQASDLEAASGYRLSAEVNSGEGFVEGSEQYIFVHDFRIFSTSLKYKVSIFKVAHGYKHYPGVFLNTINESKVEINSNAELISNIAICVKTPQIRDLIQSFMAERPNNY